MKRNLIILLSIAIGAIALAQVTTRVVGAEGRGVAGNTDGRHGQFLFGVRKYVRGNEVRLEGRFEWREVTATNTGGFGIVMLRPLAVAVNENHTVCEFNGPARLTRMSPNGPIVIEGRLSARVADLRGPVGASTTPDLIRWQFISPATNVNLAFDGAVREGDIKVFARVVSGSTTGGGGGGTSGGGRGGE